MVGQLISHVIAPSRHSALFIVLSRQHVHYRLISSYTTAWFISWRCVGISFAPNNDCNVSASFARAGIRYLLCYCGATSWVISDRENQLRTNRPALFYSYAQQCRTINSSIVVLLAYALLGFSCTSLFSISITANRIEWVLHHQPDHWDR